MALHGRSGRSKRSFNPHDDWTQSLTGLLPDDSIENLRGVREVLLNADEYVEERKEACEAFSKALGPKVVSIMGVAEDIASLLNCDDADLRATACQSLARMADYGVPAIASLLSVRDDPVKAVRQEAIVALSAIGRTESESAKEAIAEHLLRMLGLDGEPLTQTLAAEGLGVLHWGSATPVLKQMVMRSPSQEVRAAAAMALATMKEPPEVPAQLLSGKSVRERRAGLEALKELGTEAGPLADAVAERLREPLLRSKALFLLGNLGEAASPHIQRIVGHLSNPDAEVRATAVLALEKLRAWVEPADVKAVAELLNHQDPRLRATGICALLGQREEKAGEHAEAIAERVGDDEVKRPMRANFDIPEIMHQADCAAVHALGKLGALGQRYAAAVADQCLVGTTLSTRIHAIEALGSMGEEGAKHAAPLAKCLGDREPDLVLAAIGQLASLSASGLSVEYVKATVKAAKDFEGEPARFKQALSNLGANGAHELIVQALGREVEQHHQATADDDANPCRDAMEALGKVGETVCGQAQVLESLRKACNSKARGIRMTAVQTLGLIKAMTHADIVADGLKDDLEVRHAAVVALGHMAEAGAEYQYEVSQLLDSVVGVLRQSACEALGKLVEDGQMLSSDVLGRLQEVTRDAIPCVRKAAVKTLEGAM